MIEEHVGSLRETFWLTCHTKNCCYNRIVPVTGRDVYRISTTLGVPAISFVVVVEVDPADPIAFALEKTDTRYRLALDKRPVATSKRRRAASGMPPCIFLVKMNNGHTLCGLGDGRPMACHTFPLAIINGMVQAGNDNSCTCRRWTPNDIDHERDLPLLAKKQAEEEEHALVNAEWNRRVFADTSPGEFGLPDYLDFLITAYMSLPEAK